MVTLRSTRFTICAEMLLVLYKASVSITIAHSLGSVTLVNEISGANVY